ncbi:MAG TPA: MipA/OmpV family protein [Roseomonas sp.]|jgi:outer membrane scaffolding protein for murein synthesis (MipA/OmpV family)
MRHRLVTLLLLSCGTAAAQEAAPGEIRRPVLELGLIGGGGYVPDYPAADQGRLRGIIAPFLIYRGDFFRSDDQGARLRAFHNDVAEFSLSASGSFPASSDHNDARRGMPDLDWLGEIGPTLRLTLWRDSDPAQPRRILLETPVRAVFSTDFTSISHRGFTFAPELAFEAGGFALPNARLRAGIGVTFGDHRFMDYFYGVAPEFARPDRPAYGARAGYLGARASFSYRVPVTERLSVVAGARVEYFGGAANRDSPLFRQDWNISVAAGFSWSIWRSEAMAGARDDPFD